MERGRCEVCFSNFEKAATETEIKAPKTERVTMMQAWADYLDELREAGKVIPLRRESC
jgi:hypothetical protein